MICNVSFYMNKIIIMIYYIECSKCNNNAMATPPPIFVCKYLALVRITLFETRVESRLGGIVHAPS